MQSITLQKVTKYLGGRPLFEDLSFGIQERERVGLIGRNGCGKSTLLSIIAGRLEPDSGAVTKSLGLSLGYLPQLTHFDQEQASLENVVLAGQSESDHQKALVALSKCGFKDRSIAPSTLSGGWQKRLAFAKMLANDPQFLLLDEPSNHLDYNSLEWLDQFLHRFHGGFILVSHDRFILDRLCERIIEINQVFPGGCLDVRGNYSRFKEIRQESLEQLRSQHNRLRSVVRRETEWLQQGAKARTTKAKARIDKAMELSTELSSLGKKIKHEATTEITFKTSDTKSKELLSVEDLSISFDNLHLVKNLTFSLVPRNVLGVLGPNGSGKTSLIKTLANLSTPSGGKIKQATNAKVAYYDQFKASIDHNLTLKEALAGEGEFVFFGNNKTHVASWAQRFLFTPDQLNTQLHELSGGELARVLIARTMVQGASLLILDEPTNDLDIWTCEALQDALKEFHGAAILVSHDRFLLDSICTSFLSLDGQGSHTFHASLESSLRNLVTTPPEKQKTKEKATKGKSKRKKGLSFKEAKELEKLEGEIQTLEQEIEQIQESIQSPHNQSNAELLHSLALSLHEQQSSLNEKFERWAELEEKKEEND